MKQIFALILAVLFVFTSVGMVTAANQNGNGTSGPQGTGHGGPGNNGNDKPVGNVGPGSQNGGGCDHGCGGSNFGFGIISGDDFAAKWDRSFKLIDFGFAGGKSGAVAGSEFSAAGFVKNGTLTLDGSAIAGAGADSKAYKGWDFGWGYVERYVGSESWAFGLAGNTLSIDVDLARRCSGGAAFGSFSGFVAEGTKDFSGLALVPYLYDSYGYTGALAFQYGMGGYEGFAYVIGEGNTEMGAYLAISGQSGVKSGRYVDIDFCDGTKTEGLYSNAYAATLVESSKAMDPAHCRFDNDASYVNGSWQVGGMIVLTAQQGLCDPASASANAIGGYSATGKLGTDYLGSTQGYVNTQITQLPNGGVISQSWAGVQTTSTTNVPR
jgi:hypothetical protein